MKYKAVIFDLFGTLVNSFPRDESISNLRRMAAELAVPADDFISLWQAAIDDRMNGVFKNYQACVRNICQKLGIPVQDNKIELAASIRFEINKREVLSPREGAVEVLSYLKAKGYKTGLISNCSTETSVVWKSSPLSPLIDVAVLSCLVGLQKPDPRIYQMAVERLAVKPRECVFIADGMNQELNAAERLGMRAILIRIPGEDDYAAYREEWSGEVITSLREVPALVK
jgi:putative hydrolase of the HAD superfamily